MPEVYWNYRVIREKADSGYWYYIGEVYYKDGEIQSWSAPTALTGDDLNSISAMLKGYQAALEKPILEGVCDISTTNWTLKEVTESLS